jgi:DNA-binding CsgD family transcriptional regulator
LEQGLGIFDPARGRWHGDLAEALIRIGELTEAQDVIDATREHASRLGRASVLAVLDRAEALLKAAHGEHEAAVRQLTSAQERLAKLGYGLEEARVALELGRLQAERSERVGGSGRSARGAYDEATRLLRRCRAVPWLRQVETAVVGSTGSTGSTGAVGSMAAMGSVAGPGLPAGGRSAPVELDRLASTERQVAALVLEGATNREIAARLFISVKTVEATLTRVYRKLGIRSRVDIVRLAAGQQRTG